MREFCRGLIADVADRDAVDASEAYAQHIPVHGICGLLGVPESDADMFRDWIFRNFQLSPATTTSASKSASRWMRTSRKLIAQRADDPQDDLLTLVSTAEIDGEPIPVELQLGYAKLMIFAGIDTTWSAIGSGLWHLAQHADDRARLVAVADDDMLWSTAIEEILRFYAPVTMGRKVIADTEVAGCPVRAGEQMLLTFPAANHDPAQFDGRRRVPARSRPQPSRRVRARDPSVHRVEPGATRDDGRPAGMAAGVSRLRTRSGLASTVWANGQVRGPRDTARYCSTADPRERLTRRTSRKK